MNDDDFENKLLSLTRALHRPDPTPAWKQGILARAMREADAAAQKRRTLPPRWLMVSWGVAWAAAFVLNFSAPQASMPSPSSQTTAASADPGPALSETLLAYNRQLNLNLDLP